MVTPRTFLCVGLAESGVQPSAQARSLCILVPRYAPLFGVSILLPADSPKAEASGQFSTAPMPRIVGRTIESARAIL